MDEVRQWYGGYSIGGADLFSPRSIMGHVNSGFRTGRYWAGTGCDPMIHRMLDIADDHDFERLDTLYAGGSIRSAIYSNAVLTKIGRIARPMFMIMAICGYLRASGSGYGYYLAIPNKEMHEVFSDMFRNRIGKCDTGS